MNLAAPAGRLVALLRDRLLTPLLALLRDGLGPRELALSLAFGIGVGIFPVLGVSTPALAALALALRLNVAAIQLVNYAVAPLQLLLIIPFVRVGEHLLGHAPQPLTVSAGMAILARGALQAVVVLWDAIVHAALRWIVIGPALIVGLYRVFVPLLARVARRLQGTQGPT
ncbi:MAG: DUF2062 domain-containing protein [Steroidobacteraceae bacterium]